MPLEVTITSVTANTPVDIYVCELDGSNCAYISTVSTFPYVFTAPQCVEGNYFNSPQPLQYNYSSALQNTSTQTTGISINSQETGISIQTSYADISSSSSYEGGNQPYMPPYYVLAFIMRIS
jgi:hypothetical protein